MEKVELVLDLLIDVASQKTRIPLTTQASAGDSLAGACKQDR